MMQKTGKKLSLLAPKVPLAKAISVSSFLAYTSRDGVYIIYTCMHIYTHIYIYSTWITVIK